jgi:hypothetical protein
MKKTTVTLELKYSPLGFEALVAPTEDGVFWLSGHSSGLNRAVWRAGEKVVVTYYPDDQFAREDSNGSI